MKVEYYDIDNNINYHCEKTQKSKIDLKILDNTK